MVIMVFMFGVFFISINCKWWSVYKNLGVGQTNEKSEPQTDA